MKLDRNVNPDGKGKYALIKLRDLKPSHFKVHFRHIAGTRAGYREFYQIPNYAVDFGVDGDGDEFFVIRLKDKYATPALQAYAGAAAIDDLEYAEEIRGLARQAEHHPEKKRPD